MRLDVLPHSTGRHPECPGDLLQCEQLQRSGHGTNSIHTTSSGTPTEITVSSAEPMDGFRAMVRKSAYVRSSREIARRAERRLVVTDVEVGVRRRGRAGDLGGTDQAVGDGAGVRPVEIGRGVYF